MFSLYIPGPEEEEVENGEDLQNGDVEETEDESGFQEEDQQNITDQPMEDTENS